MAKICIVGTEGAGKTIFLSVFAMRYQDANTEHPWMEFKNRETARYVAEVWGTLASQEWPPSTPPGDFTKLEWSLHTAVKTDQKEHNITVLDAPGQDIRAIFDSDPDSLNANQRELQRRLEEADILLVLVNLVEAIRATDPVQQANVQIPIKLMLDSVLARKNARVAILLSQHDQLRPYFDSISVPRDDPMKALRACLPTVYGVAARTGERLKVFFIASVAETEPFVDEQGKAWRRPRADFRSEGLNEVMLWLVTGAKGVRDDEQHAETTRKEAEISSYKEELRRLKQPRTKFRALVGAIAFAVLFVIGVIGTVYIESSLKDEHEIPSQDWENNPIPIPEGKWGMEDDITLTNKSQYDFISPRICVYLEGKQIIERSAGEGSILRAGDSKTWPKVFNFNKKQRNATGRVFCKTVFSQEEKSRKRDSLIKVLFAALGIILFSTSKLPHRNDSMIREIEQHLG